MLENNWIIFLEILVHHPLRSARRGFGYWLPGLPQAILPGLPRLPQVLWLREYLNKIIFIIELFEYDMNEDW